MNFDNLNEKNVLLYAMKLYDNPDAVIDGLNTFDGDWKHVKYIRRLLNKYKSDGELKERLILNHIIVLTNLFTNAGAVRILFTKVPTTQWSMLKTFLEYLCIMPDVVRGIHGMDITSTYIPIDEEIVKRLREL
jgi:hypothetical protein